MNSMKVCTARVFALATLMGALAILSTTRSVFAQSNPFYEIVISDEVENPPALEITVNFEDGSLLTHTVQGNGTTQYENPGYGDIASIVFQGQTVRPGEEVVIQIGETEVCYRLFFWWFDSGYYRMSFRREVMWA